MATELCVLYDDPVSGYPPAYAREGIPRIERYYDGQTTPTPDRIVHAGRAAQQRVR
jgi:formate dehydrogenase